jgi:hypothetical protein
MTVEVSLLFGIWMILLLLQGLVTKLSVVLPPKTENQNYLYHQNNSTKKKNKHTTPEHVYKLTNCKTLILRHGRHCMVVGFTTTYAISAYHH